MSTQVVAKSQNFPKRAKTQYFGTKKSQKMLMTCEYDWLDVGGL